MDYSGFDRESWPKRMNSLHREAAESLILKRTKAELLACESLHGCRYSELLRLSYFDPVRMLIIDPMHNLFLGSAKSIFGSTKVLFPPNALIPFNSA